MDIGVEQLTIGALAKAAGVNVETIRFYQRRGLLTEPDRLHGSIRRYGVPDVERVKFVKSAQRLGFSLDEVAGLLQLEDGTRCDEARLLGQERLSDVRARLADLTRMEAALARLVDDCCSRKGKVHCPLIAALREASSTEPVSQPQRPGKR